VNRTDLSLEGANPWQTVSSRIVYDDGRLRFREDVVVQPDGDPGKYAYLEVALPVVAIVPIDADGNIYLVRQWRYPWNRNSWEIPTGGAEPGETPIETARRELAEEVGLHATEWEPLGTGNSAATISSSWFFFIARGLSPVDDGQYAKDGGEADMIARAIPLADAIEAAMDGRIEHGMSAMGILRAARRLGV
jgi:8-oxo-dGTP pyrophosphatase MutT (NUDIX family)